MFRNRFLFAATAIILSAVFSIPGDAQNPSRMFAPYVDMSKMADQLPQIQSETGTKMLTLAFIVSGNGCVPSWGGSVPVSTDTSIASGIGRIWA